MRQLKVVVAGSSGLLANAVAARLSAEPDAFEQPPRQLTDATLLADSGEAVGAALTGADALFVELPVDPVEPDSAAASLRAVTLLAKSARERGVRHVICCTAASPLNIVGIAVRRMDVWAEAETVWRQSRLGVTYLILPSFYQELLHTFRIRRVAGHLSIGIPCGSTAFDMMDAEDAAEVVAACLKLGNRCYGRCLPMSAGKVTVKQLADTMTLELGVEVLDQKVSFEQLRSRGDPALVDLANNFEFILRFDQRLTRTVVEEFLGRGVTGFTDWCHRNQSKLLGLLNEA